MADGWTRASWAVLAAAVLCLAGLAPANGQSAAPKQPKAANAVAAKAQGKATAKTAASGEKTLLAEDVFKDIRVLRGMPLDEFMDTMGFFAASLSMTCTDCHISESGGDWARYVDETPRMATARKMVLMVNKINAENFGGSRSVTCYTCHRFDANTPKTVPSLMLQYSVPPPDDPNEVTAIAESQGLPTADQVFDKYFKAIGGEQKLAGLKSVVVKGTYDGFDTGHEPRPEEVYAQAPAQRTTIVHLRGEADKVWTYDGHEGWIASSDKPVPLMVLTGGELEGAKLDAMLSFPLQIKQAYPTWRVGDASIDDHDVLMLQGTAAGHTSLKLYFDKQSGLLVRQVRYSNTKIGTVPVQVDYSDYRDVAGIKLPFQWINTWTDGQSTTLVTDIQTNVSIDPAKLSKPQPAKMPESAELR